MFCNMSINDNDNDDEFNVFYFVRNVKSADEVKVDEHSRRCTKRDVVVEWKVVEFVIGQWQLLRLGYRQLLYKSTTLAH